MTQVSGDGVRAAKPNADTGVIRVTDPGTVSAAGG